MPRVFQPIAHKIDAVSRTNDIKTEEKVDFSALHLSPHVLSGLKNAGFERPSPIQLKAIPIGRIGLDVIAQAKSGTGKTCVFGVIVLEAMNIKVQKCQCVVVAPTREIAAQIQAVLSTLACDMSKLKCTLVIGGTSIQEDKEAVVGAHVVIGTPGRLLHLIEDAILDTECVRTLVLDEADKLVDDSFYSQVKSLANQLPKSKQVLAMSATYHKDIDSKFHTLMRDPYYVRLSADNLGLEGIHHYFYTVKTDKVKHQIFCNKISRLVEVLSNVVFEQCLVFSNYQNGAEEVGVCLTREGFSNQLIAGSMLQKDRTQAMTDFRECRFRVLISTDVTARGIDNEHVDLVINMDLPVNTLGNPDPHTYLHRAGRAGRFGKYGSSISIIANQKERMFMQDLEEKYQVEVQVGPAYKQISDLLRRSKASEAANSCDTATVHLPTNSRLDSLQQTSPTHNAQESDKVLSPAPQSESTNSQLSHSGSSGKDLDVLRSTVTVTPKTFGATVERMPHTEKMLGTVKNEDTKTCEIVGVVHSGDHNGSSKNSCAQNGDSANSCAQNGDSVNSGDHHGDSVNGSAHNGGSVNSSAQNGDFIEANIDKDAALSSLGSLGKIPSQTESAEDDASVFKFSSQDVNTYQEDLSLFQEALGSLSLMTEGDLPVETPSTSGSIKPPSSDVDGSDTNRSRRGSKSQKKARKPPKSLSVTSPKSQSGRRAAAADLANAAILSPHTPKWRSEAVSSAGCLIHSKAINVKFLLENYLCVKCDFVEKEYDNDWRGLIPPKSEIIGTSSTPPCERQGSGEKIKVSRFVSHGFVAYPDLDPIAGKLTPPDPMAGERTPPDPLAGKRSSPDPLAGKRTSPDPLAGKRTPPDPMAGKRTPPDPMAGKRTPPDPMAGKRTPPDPMAGKRTPPDPMAGKRTPPDSMAGKRTPPDVNAHQQVRHSHASGNEHNCRQTSIDKNDIECSNYDISKHRRNFQEQSDNISDEHCTIHCRPDYNACEDTSCCSARHQPHSSLGSMRTCCAHLQQAHHTSHHHRPTDIPDLYREQSKDSGVFSHSSPYQYSSCCSPLPPWHWWHMPPMSAPPQMLAPPPRPPMCASPLMCTSPQMYAQPSAHSHYYNKSMQYNSPRFNSFHSVGGGRGQSFSDAGNRSNHSNEGSAPSWGDVWEKTWGQ